MADNKYTIHKSKKSQVDKDLTAKPSLKKNIAKTPYRLDFVRKVSGVEFYCDTKASDLLSTRDSFKCIERPIRWLVASASHDRDYALIEKYVEAKVEGIVVYGGLGQDMKKKLGGVISKFDASIELDEAVQKAYQMAEEGDAIVFSPSCAIKDDYNNYADRGQAFIQMVNDLKERE